MDLFERGEDTKALRRFKQRKWPLGRLSQELEVSQVEPSHT